MRSDDHPGAGLAPPFRSTDLFGPISSALAGRLWRPDPAEPMLADWWRPLAELSRRLRADLCHWPIDVDEYDLVGRVDRVPRPRVWVYRHHRGPAELAVDDDGRTYRFLWSTTRQSLGRLLEVDNRSAVHRAGLTELVEPISYRDELYQAQFARWDAEHDERAHR